MTPAAAALRAAIPSANLVDSEHWTPDLTKSELQRAWQAIPAGLRGRSGEMLNRVDERLRTALMARDEVSLSAVLLGPTGCGKSTAAALLVHRALSECADEGRRGVVLDVCWTNATDLALAERRHPLGQGEPPLVRRARTAGALVVDDIGLEATEGAIFPVLSHRYHHRLPTIATTGLTKSELSAHLGAAGVRRLTEQHAGFRVLVVDCHDMTADLGRRMAAGGTR